MSYLAIVVPPLQWVDRRLPFTRDQVMLLMIASNEILLGVETYLAHKISGTIRPNEWIPIIFGPVAGLLLLAAGLLALRQRRLAMVTATIVLLVSIAVGLLGAYFHLIRITVPGAETWRLFFLDLAVWGPPILGPLTFALVGLMGISAVWQEDPPDSGRLVLLDRYRLQLPYGKTQAYFFMISLGTLATVISSVLDHARTPFDNLWLWVPTGVGVFAVVVAAMLGARERPSRGDLSVYTLAMVLLVLVGATGSLLHVLQNLTPGGEFVAERFLRGAPPLAPLLFSDMGALGLIVLLDPKTQPD